MDARQKRRQDHLEKLHEAFDAFEEAGGTPIMMLQRNPHGQITFSVEGEGVSHHDVAREGGEGRRETSCAGEA